MRTFADLRNQGIRHLEQLAGRSWTDFNTHDPGITLLEALCYTLSDLGYRAYHDVSDLLADGGVANPYASLHAPAELLTTRAVTLADLRRLLLDIDGVKNAFVEQVDERIAENGDRLRGVYRIVVELASDGEGSHVRREVGRRLHQNRGLGEDFSEIVILEPLQIRVDAKIEIGRVDDPAVTYGQILDAIAEVISPTIPFTSLDERLAAGLRIDEAFDGPLLSYGFVADEALARARRRTDIHSSDIVHAVMDVPGVRAITEVKMSADRVSDPWSLAIPRERGPYLDRQFSLITLQNAGLAVAIGAAAPAARPPARVKVGPGAGITNPAFRNRNVGVYRSVQHHLPDLYGIGEFGLADEAPPERRAQAKQLKAFLMFFDQLMANHTEQLAHVKDLFSIHADERALGRTYFSQRIDEPTLRLDAVATATADTLAAMVEANDPRSARKHRFLNHLLARVAENLNDRYSASAGSSSDEAETTKLIRDKQFFLQDYPRISGSRGTAFDGLAVWGMDKPSGLEDRIRLKLGLDDAAEETMAIVEHIHLRPGQRHRFDEFLGQLPTDVRDPYSLKLTFVFPGERGRFGKTDPATPLPGQSFTYPFREVVEQTIRGQTPAHLCTYVLWLDEAEWEAFSYAHFEWRRRRRENLAGTLGINLGLDRALPAVFPNLPVLSGVVKVKKDSPRVADYGAAVVVDVDSTQDGAAYALLRGADNTTISAAKVDGTGSKISITSTPVAEDMDVRVQVERLLDDTVLLYAVLPLRVRANPAIRVTAQSALVDSTASAALVLENSQTNVLYSVHARTLGDADFFVPDNLPALLVPNAPRVRVAPVPQNAIELDAYRPMGTPLRGNGGTLVLPFGALDQDSIVVVRAHKEHGANPSKATDVQLATAVVFLARPGAASGLSLVRVASNQVRVSGGEAGVFYELRDAAGALGRPAYFHRRDDAAPPQNRGLGRTRLTRDFVVSRGRVPADAPRASAGTLDPIITLTRALPPSGVKVMATRARTGVSWVLAKAFPISTP